MGAWWTSLDPVLRRNLLLGGGFLLLLLIVYLFVVQSSDPPTRGPRPESFKQILTDSNPRDLGVDALLAEMRTLRQQVVDAQREIATLQTGQSAVDLQRRLQQQADDIKKLADELKQVRDAPKPERTSAPPPASPTPVGGAGSPASPPPAAGPGSPARPPAAPPPPAASLFAPPPPGMPALPAGSSLPSGAPPPRSPPKIRVHTHESAPAGAATSSGATPGATPGVTRPVTRDRSDAGRGKAETAGAYLPAGSIISGTLLTGLDAPTGQGARQDPTPALLRVKLDAILPNLRQLDIRECFLLAGGHGDLSAERAYLRAETLSCIRADNGVIEVSLDAYATGEDGKAGIGGRVVSKQGQILGKALVAGFLDAFAQAFQQQPVATISTGRPSRSVDYQSQLTGAGLQSASLSGVGSALDRLSQFYIQMAENMFPVVEINAGRKIDFIVVRGRALDLQP